MATLFFEGFEKGIIFNKLDSNYWQSQFKQFPKYAFGGYGNYLTNSNTIGISYQYSSPNGGILPNTGFVSESSAYYYYTPATLLSNSYPGLGSPPGFLAFTNIDTKDPNTVEYPTYLRISGFSEPSGDQTYFGFRSLGLETKNIDHSTYPHRHILFSMCSGNNTGLVVNIAKVTGSNLTSIYSQQSTMALEIMQNDTVIGYFDMNISGIIQDYKIASLGTGNKVFTISKSSTIPYSVAPTPGANPFSSILSRWVHSEFLIDDSDPQQSYLSIKLEGIDIGVINSDPEVPKEEWDTQLPISTFKFDNIRFYNRTYSSTGLLLPIPPGGSQYGGELSPSLFAPTLSSRYYMNGSVWLLDDITLIDNIGEPSFFVGPTAKVMQLVPGVDLNLASDYGRPDRIREWPTNLPSSGYRKAFAFLDADTGTIQATNSGLIASTAFSNRSNPYPEALLPDSASRWRDNYNDAVGGMKIYNSARKNYLDTKFCNVFLSGITDQYINNTTVCLHMNELPPQDFSAYQRIVYSTETVILSELQPKFGNGNYYFPSTGSYLYTAHSDLGLVDFTIDSWIKFNTDSNKISIFDKYSLNPIDTSIGANRTYYGYALDATISGLEYTMYHIITWGSLMPVYKTILNYPNILNTGEWNYLSVVRDTGNNYSLIVYINGQSGISYTEILYNTNNGIPTGTGNYNSLYTMPSNTILSNSIRNMISAAYIDGVGLTVKSLSIGKAGSLDDYVITTGIVRHNENFIAPVEPFKALKDDYYQIGSDFSVSKTTYQTYQYYSLKNPATNQNWTLPQISGLVFGVKKL